MPKVSVIIPTYNGERWILESIRSVLGQTYPLWELILVDDGSTDGTKEIIQNLASSDHRVKTVFKTNGGVASARNAGIQAARGRYVSMLDQDDLFEPTKLERQAAFLERHPEIGMVYSHFLEEDGQGRVLRKQPDESRTEFRELWTSCRVHLGSTLIRKSVLDRVGPLNEKVGWRDDFDLVLRIARVSKIAFQEGVVFHYRWHGNNASAGDERIFQRLTLKVLNSVGPAPEAGVSSWQFRRRVARVHYCLARLEREQKSFVASTYHFWKAVQLYPAVGLLFREQLHTSTKALWQMVKPYGALLHSTMMACVPALHQRRLGHAHRD